MILLTSEKNERKTLVQIIYLNALSGYKYCQVKTKEFIVLTLQNNNTSRGRSTASHEMIAAHNATPRY